jgi:hypothetical protein
MSFPNNLSGLGNKNPVLDASILETLAARGALVLGSVSSNPLTLRGIADGTTITLTWNDPGDNVAYYIIYIASPNGSLNPVRVSGNVTSYTFTNLNRYTTYTFYVRNYDSLGSYGTSNYVTLQTTCFLQGTKILYWNKIKNCEEYIAVENLRKGMEVKTALNGYVKIAEIGKSIVYNFVKNKGNKDGLYKLSKDSCPELFEDLYMTGAHAILVDKFTSDKQKDDVSEMYGNVYITGDKYRLPICYSDEAEPFNIEAGFNIWHFALEHSDYYGNYGVYANGLLVESTSIRYMKEIFDGELLQE